MMDRAAKAAVATAALGLVMGCAGIPERTARSQSHPPASALPRIGEWRTATDAEIVAMARAVTRVRSDVRLDTIGRTGLDTSGRTRFATFTHVPTGLEFAFIPGFDPADAPSLGGVARPLAAIPPFLIAAAEVSAADYACWVERFGLDQYPSPSSESDPLAPVMRVRWVDAAALCRAAGWDLPLEFEWDWACRAGFDGLGDDAVRELSMSGFLDDDALRAWAAHGWPAPLRVTSLPRNALGVRGLLGGAWEWCGDRAEGGWPDLRVQRGGAFPERPAGIEARDVGRERWEIETVGFRPVIRLLQE